MAFSLLSRPIQKFIRDQKWDSLHPIQLAAIQRILSTQNNYIIAARTASGKTEAAFLPVLSAIDPSESGVQVLYISPLVALINDQFRRVEDLSRYLNVRITKWHGEAKKSQKEHLIHQPSGILLITPESLEAMFANRPQYIELLFSNLKFVIIDEIHMFLGKERGIQLQSLLHRIKEKSNCNYRGIGLSATLGDFQLVKTFFGAPEHTKVLVDKHKQPVEATFHYFPSDDKLPADLFKELFRNTMSNRALIFPNSRARVEEIAVVLKKISEKVGSSTHYFAHHSSVSRELREFIEHFAKHETRSFFNIVCTSTLELGIDLGSIDLVAQVDSTYSVASLAQRFGRSGRKIGSTSKLHLYATNPWSLLQSVACYLLYEDGFVEPPDSMLYPIDILFQQTLSVLKERSGCQLDDLLPTLLQNPAFSQIPVADVKLLWKEMIASDYIEDLKREIILGIAGEALVNRRSFYSVFKSKRNFKVFAKNKLIGEIPLSPTIRVDEHILLAARTWKIEHIHYERRRIQVVNATDGKKPIFGGTSSLIHPVIWQRMFDLLVDDAPLPPLSPQVLEPFQQLRSSFQRFPILNKKTDRPALMTVDGVTFYSFTGTRINRTLQVLFNFQLKKTIPFQPAQSCFQLLLTKEEFIALIAAAKNLIPRFSGIIDQFTSDQLSKFPLPRWSEYLPESLKKKQLGIDYFDVPGTVSYLEVLEVVFVD